jgi:hypothetical protein
MVGFTNVHVVVLYPTEAVPRSVEVAKLSLLANTLKVVGPVVDNEKFPHFIAVIDTQKLAAGVMTVCI